MATVVVMGMGAMGSVYAALMAAAGHQVHGVCLWPEHAQAVAEAGLRVYGASGDRTVRLASVGTGVPAAPLVDARGVDLVILATKSFDVAAAAGAVAHLVGPRTVVQAIQNGIGSAQQVAGVIGPQRLSVGVAGGFGASLQEPGVVHHHGMELVRFGSFGELTWEEVERGAEVWRSAGFDATVSADVPRMVWEKLLMNVAFSAVSALTGFTIGQILADPDAWWLARACVREATAVAAAEGVVLQVGDPIEHVRTLGGSIAGARPSMLLDALAQRRCEIDVINGGVVTRGELAGVPTPVNEALSRAVRARETGYLDPEGAR